MSHEPWEPCDAPPAPEPRSAEEWAREFMASDGFALSVRGEADAGYLEGLLSAELTRFAAQEAAALQAALTEAQREIERLKGEPLDVCPRNCTTFQQYGDCDHRCPSEVVKLKRERDALQRRVAALEEALRGLLTYGNNQAKVVAEAALSSGADSWET